MPTYGVVAHGLDQIYPSAHRGVARDMIKNKGAVITEYTSNTIPNRENFPMRNRLVAGMVDAVIVVESAIKGGSLIRQSWQINTTGMCLLYQVQLIKSILRGAII
jgi:DNA processing protein